jgi:hypothetical protein
LLNCELILFLSLFHYFIGFAIPLKPGQVLRNEGEYTLQCSVHSSQSLTK